MSFLRNLGILTLTILTLSCAPGMVRHKAADWNSQSPGYEGRNVNLRVADVDIEAKIVSISEDKITINQAGLQSEIPTEVISTIDVSRNSKAVLGASIGGAAGIAAGFAAGGAVSDAKGAGVLAHPISLLLILGGSIGGGMWGAGQAGHDVYNLDHYPKSFILSPDVGAQITPTVIRAFDLFEDLAVSPDDQILQVQIFELTNGRYLLLYDESYIGMYRVGAKSVDASYIKTQADKLKKK